MSSNLMEKSFDTKNFENFIRKQIESGASKKDILKVASSNDVKDILETIYDIEIIKIEKLKKGLFDSNIKDTN